MTTTANASDQTYRLPGLLYGLAGERSLNERELPWLSGYDGSRPVRAGNAAAGQVAGRFSRTSRGNLFAMRPRRRR